MGGILKNALSNEEQILKEKTANEPTSEFRQKVYENTQLNAKLTGKNLLNTTNVTGGGRFIPKDTLLMKREERAKKGELTKEEEEERLQWNQENLAANEITKQQFQDIHVDEPKTPYQGAVDPHGEYYNVDDEDNLNDFSLGEPEIQIPEEEENEENIERAGKDVQIDNPDVEFIEQDDEPTDDEAEDDEEEEESAEARHKRFEEMRKQHYNVKDIFHKK
ncbi:protein Glc8p [Monosporozyma unispora]